MSPRYVKSFATALFRRRPSSVSASSRCSICVPFNRLYKLHSTQSLVRRQHIFVPLVEIVPAGSAESFAPTHDTLRVPYVRVVFTADDGFGVAAECVGAGLGLMFHDFTLSISSSKTASAFHAM